MRPSNQERFWTSLALVGLVVGCGSTLPDAEGGQDPWASFDEKDDSPSPPAPKPPLEDEPKESPAPDDGGASPAEVDDVPAEYELSVADCRLLGEKYGALTRKDQVAKLPSKLEGEQREKVLRQIDDVAAKMEERWTSSCEENLVDKVILGTAFKCAVRAESVPTFDECLNGPEQ